ncbi:MAG: hypothetical protein FIB01_13930 [Gemmatimonadetes bacterium]|nr:hypothetical protein [Gemmatimonadota bacterium]
MPGIQDSAVAAARGRSYYPRRPAAGFLLAIGLAACASAPPATRAAAPATVDSTLADSSQRATAPRRPQQVGFEWSMTDRDARFSGKGVVRLAPPYRARLDLFGPRGEAYVIAVLDGEELRLAPAGATELLPPAAFLWASLGVFRRPMQPLTATRRTGSGVELAFADGAERWRFQLAAEGLRQVEWQGPDGGRRTVELTGHADQTLPQRGAYRDWVAFRELNLTVTGVEDVDGFSEDIWVLGAR